MLFQLNISRLYSSLVMKIFIHHIMVALYITEKEMFKNLIKQPYYDNKINGKL